MTDPTTTPPNTANPNPSDQRAVPAIHARFTASVIEGPDLGLAFPLSARPLQIGKGSGCDIVLTDSAVSQQHLELRVTAGLVCLRDLGSTNGTFVGAERLINKSVESETVVKIGRTRLLLRCEVVPQQRDTSAGAGPIPNLAMPPTSSDPSADLVHLPYKEARELALNAFERTYLAAAFTRNDHNLSRTAEDIGLTRHYLRRLLREHGLIPFRPAGRPRRPN
jgi:pSer/pThr/pTyr-binding forkhead associated (FHA) protein